MTNRQTQFEGRYCIRQNNPDRDCYGEIQWGAEPLEVWQWFEEELRIAYNTVKVPDAFDMKQKTIVLDNDDPANAEQLFQFILNNLTSKYFRSLAKKIGDYIEGKKQVPEYIAKNFDEFYTLYPKQVNRKATLLKYTTINPDQALHNNIIEGVLKQTYLWNKEGREKQFIPAPNVWLNQRRWEDGELNNITLGDVKSEMDRIFED